MRGDTGPSGAVGTEAGDKGYRGEVGSKGQQVS